METAIVLLCKYEGKYKIELVSKNHIMNACRGVEVKSHAFKNAWIHYSREKLWPWQYQPMRKSDCDKSVARNWCIPSEKTLRCSPVEFCVQVN
jgi:hypothetical protein